MKSDFEQQKASPNTLGINGYLGSAQLKEISKEHFNLGN